jgi:hypothetical protein
MGIVGSVKVRKWPYRDTSAYYQKNKLAVLARTKAYQKRKKEEIRIQKQGYYKKNKAHILAVMKARPGYRDYMNAYRRKRDATPKGKIEASLRARLKEALRAIKGARKTIPALTLVGCSHSELMLHIQKQFKAGMSWNNHGVSGWHIDHIKPCSAFNLLDPEEQKKCFHFTNLQPLWWHENISKGNKILCK